jgi:hypothetical protein
MNPETPKEINTIHQPLVELVAPFQTEGQESWIMRHKKLALGVAAAGYAVAGALSLTEFQGTYDGIKHDIKWAVPAFLISETFAWTGAGVMLGSAGKNIGNPLTAMQRIKEIKNEIKGSAAFRKGWLINVAGASGTSALIIYGAASSLPESSWALAGAASITSLALSGLPFAGVLRKNNIQTIEEKK